MLLWDYQKNAIIVIIGETVNIRWKSEFKESKNWTFRKFDLPKKSNFSKRSTFYSKKPFSKIFFSIFDRNFSHNFCPQILDVISIKKIRWIFFKIVVLKQKWTMFVRKLDFYQTPKIFKNSKKNTFDRDFCIMQFFFNRIHSP